MIDQPGEKVLPDGIGSAMSLALLIDESLDVEGVQKSRT